MALAERRELLARAMAVAARAVAMVDRLERDMNERSVDDGRHAT